MMVNPSVCSVELWTLQHVKLQTCQQGWALKCINRERNTESNSRPCLGHFKQTIWMQSPWQSPLNTTFLWKTVIHNRIRQSWCWPMVRNNYMDRSDRSTTTCIEVTDQELWTDSQLVRGIHQMCQRPGHQKVTQACSWQCLICYQCWVDLIKAKTAKHWTITK